MYLEKDKTRALTRYFLEKKKISMGNLLSVSYFIKDESEDVKKRAIGKRANTPKMRSFFQLGNVRKYGKGKDKLTIQERKFKHKIVLWED